MRHGVWHRRSRCSRLKPLLQRPRQPEACTLPVGAGVPAKYATRCMAPALPVFAAKAAPTAAPAKSSRSGAVTLLELFLAAARARVVTANVFQGVAYRLLMAVVAVRAVHMAVIMIMVVVMVVVAVRAMNVRLLGHCGVTPGSDRRGLSHHCAISAGLDESVVLSPVRPEGCNAAVVRFSAVWPGVSVAATGWCAR